MPPSYNAAVGAARSAAGRGTCTVNGEVVPAKHDFVAEATTTIRVRASQDQQGGDEPARLKLDASTALEVIRRERPVARQSRPTVELSRAGRQDAGSARVARRVYRTTRQEPNRREAAIATCHVTRSRSKLARRPAEAGPQSPLPKKIFVS